MSRSWAPSTCCAFVSLTPGDWHPSRHSLPRDWRPLKLAPYLHWFFHNKQGPCHSKVCQHDLFLSFEKKKLTFVQLITKNMVTWLSGGISDSCFVHGWLIFQGYSSGHFRRYLKTEVIHIIVILQQEALQGPLCINVSMAIRYLNILFKLLI